RPGRAKRVAPRARAAPARRRQPRRWRRSAAARMAAASGKPRADVVRRFEVPDAEVVCCHAFSKDESLLAVAPNTEDVLIFRLTGAEFQSTHVLSRHTQRVTGLSWSCDGRLVSCSEDRTAYVWEWSEAAGNWRAVLVELRAPRAALCVQWSPDGKRFAVGLSSKDVAVCYYEGTVGCWVALKIGRSIHQAAVGALAWHPTSQYLAVGSFDRRCLVYDVTEENMLPSQQPPFGEAQVSEEASAWVNAVAFSPKGRFLAFAAQDATVSLKDLKDGPGAEVCRIRWRQLPFLRLAFVGESQLVACGFDCTPVLLRQAGGRWAVAAALECTGASPAAPPAGVDGNAFDQARKAFGGRAAAAPGGGAGACHTGVISADAQR
ncbi:unnamed protein product, partial [Prorocentrum cordatum]